MAAACLRHRPAVLAAKALALPATIAATTLSAAAVRSALVATLQRAVACLALVEAVAQAAAAAIPRQENRQPPLRLLQQGLAAGRSFTTTITSTSPGSILVGTTATISRSSSRLSLPRVLQAAHARASAQQLLRMLRIRSGHCPEHGSRPIHHLLLPD